MMRKKRVKKALRYIKSNTWNLISATGTIATLILVILYHSQETTSKYTIIGKSIKNQGYNAPLFDVEYEKHLDSLDSFYGINKNNENAFGLNQWLTIPIWVEATISNERNNAFSIIDYRIEHYDFKTNNLNFKIYEELKIQYEFNPSNGIVEKNTPIFFNPKESKIISFLFNIPIIPNDINTLNYLDSTTRTYYPKQFIEKYDSLTSTDLVKVHIKGNNKSFFICNEALINLINNINLKIRIKTTDNSGRTEYSNSIAIRI